MKHVKTYENFSIRDEYQKYGAENFYKNFGNSYVNPHENQIDDAIIFANDNWNVDFTNTLDLCAGSGEITRILLQLNYNNIDAVDPYTSDIYKKKTGRDCEKISFDDIYNGSLQNRYYSTIVCSFALHLVDESKLPILCYRLSTICDNLLILSPHKRPQIKPECGFDKIQEKIVDRVRMILYKSHSEKL